MLPSGWSAKESRSKPGVLFYVNQYTGESQWDVPTAPAIGESATVTASHILRKHSGSRRPSSWRCENITQSKQDSIDQINAIKTQLENVLATEGQKAMEDLFYTIASTESDCSSNRKGGSLFALHFFLIISVIMGFHDRRLGTFFSRTDAKIL